LPVKIKQNAKRFEILSKKKTFLLFFCLDEEEEKDPEKLIENRWKKVFPAEIAPLGSCCRRRRRRRFGIVQVKLY
jgi:hypothetical protein